MSRHSKWHKIQHKKGVIDAKRGSLFTKLARAVTVAAQTGGGDSEMNFALRLAIEKAKAGNMPKENIERAIRRGTGAGEEGVVLQEVLYEAFGPGGGALLVESVTDNVTRTVSEIKNVLSQAGVSLGAPGSVQWQFEKKGVVGFTQEERKKIKDWGAAQLSFLDAGVDDIQESEDEVQLITDKSNLKRVVEAVTVLGITPDESGLEWLPKETMELSPDKAEKLNELCSNLDDLDDVKDVYTNVRL
ncbi:MAG TPA: YebC/PmpR family DNA-binding transcriptional regulator [Patescibacteria group bacterium]|nr:YebC/PmpR family DNA-binding transcriptional regulator [Patescibacteria group bacterium]